MTVALFLGLERSDLKLLAVAAVSQQVAYCLVVDLQNGHGYVIARLHPKHIRGSKPSIATREKHAKAFKH